LEPHNAPLQEETILPPAAAALSRNHPSQPEIKNREGIVYASFIWLWSPALVSQSCSQAAGTARTRTALPLQSTPARVRQRTASHRTDLNQLQPHRRFPAGSRGQAARRRSWRFQTRAVWRAAASRSRGEISKGRILLFFF